MIKKFKKFILKKLSFFFDTPNEIKKFNTCFHYFKEHLTSGAHGKIIKGINRITKKDTVLKLIHKKEKEFVKKEFNYFFLNMNHKNT